MEVGRVCFARGLKIGNFDVYPFLVTRIVFWNGGIKRGRNKVQVVWHGVGGSTEGRQSFRSWTLSCGPDRTLMCSPFVGDVRLERLNWSKLFSNGERKQETQRILSSVNFCDVIRPERISSID